MFHVLTVFVDYVAFLAIALFVAIIGRIVYNIFAHPLRRYPGPRSWAATRLVWAYYMESGSYHHQLHKLHLQYGPVVRVAPDELSYIDPRAWNDIYGTRHGHAIIPKNNVWAKQEESKAPVSIVSVDEATHLRNRRALMGAFTEHAVIEHAPLLESLVGTMIQKFRDKVDAGNGRAVVNIVDWLNFLTFDISGALSFGESFHSVHNGKAHPWVEISCSFGKGIALVASINFFSPLNRLLKYAMPAKVMEKMVYHKELTKEKFLQRLAMHDRTSSQDYVGSILQYNREKGEKIPQEEIQENMTLLIFAGSETTSSAMASVLNQLVRNPAALRRTRNELSCAFKNEDEITVSSVSKLEYLTAVIQEGIRLGPPAAIGLPRVVPKTGEIICDQWVPEGTFVSVNQYPAFRSPSNFTDPETFFPERFLDAIPGDNLSVFEPFLVGRHKCIGQKLAWAEMRLTLARLLYAFDIKAEGHVADFGDQKTFIFWEKVPLEMQLRT